MSSQIQNQREHYRMNDYQNEQWNALGQILDHIGSIDSIHSGELSRAIQSYLQFRHELDKFLAQHFGRLCTQACFESQTSACCSKDGIITFWADLVITVYHSTREQIGDLTTSIQSPLYPHKCIYLGSHGCRWRIPPLGCALFLCDGVQTSVLEPRPDLGAQWEHYRAMGKSFRWPDRPVLFDRLEQVFMALGCRSPLMYINTSPGLLRIKQTAGLL